MTNKFIAYILIRHKIVFYLVNFKINGTELPTILYYLSYIKHLLF